MPFWLAFQISKTSSTSFKSAPILQRQADVSLTQTPQNTSKTLIWNSLCSLSKLYTALHRCRFLAEPTPDKLPFVVKCIWWMSQVEKESRYWDQPRSKYLALIKCLEHDGEELTLPQGWWKILDRGRYGHYNHRWARRYGMHCVPKWRGWREITAWQIV